MRKREHRAPGSSYSAAVYYLNRAEYKAQHAKKRARRDAKKEKKA